MDWLAGFVPRVIGVLMAFGGLAYLFSSFANFLAPALAAGLFPLIGAFNDGRSRRA